MNWETLYQSINQCHSCKLCETRLHTVPGEGDHKARLLFVGEGPGEKEDEQGRPFVGKAGMLLDKMITAIGMQRQDVYIANIVKCRPPNNRVPGEEEALACLPYLRAQTALIHPRVIVCLGATAARYIIDPSVRITRDRGEWTERKGYYLMATYHPAALLRDPSKKREAWEDFQKIRDKLLEMEGGGKEA
ncbi:MAG: uracil-DNA glycosylase [Christensenellales bacterium]